MGVFTVRSPLSCTSFCWAVALVQKAVSINLNMEKFTEEQLTSGLIEISESLKC